MASIPLKEISEKVSEICKKHNAYLYDIMFVKEGPKKFLRIFADTEEGIGIDLCEKISRDVSDYLDENNLIDTEYSLEVSSPGAERKLRCESHFLAVMNKKISVSLYSPINDSKTFTGTLKAYTKDYITMETQNETVDIPHEKIADSHLYFDVNEFLRLQDKN